MNDTMNKKSSKMKLLAIVVVLVLAAGAGTMVYFHYLSPDAWKCGAADADSGIDADGNHWLGASEPRVVVHEVVDYDCPHCPEAHRRLRYELRSDLDEIRLVRHDYARMSCVPNDAERRRSSCVMARAGFCAGQFGKFWQWNDAVMETPRPLTGDPRKTYLDDMVKRFEFDSKKFDECLYSPETVAASQKHFEFVRKNKIKDTPTYIVNGKQMTLTELIEFLN